jgi:tetratricopeptide (TPR) repeat protein
MPYRFVGRSAELALLDAAYAGGSASVIALVATGGQGKTAIVQHWLKRLEDAPPPADGVFLWSFYRGRDADLCLRELYAYAEGLAAAPDVSSGYLVDRLMPRLRKERWAIVLDGAELVQAEAGPWFGRIVHPELDRLLAELASAAMPGVAVVTSRFPLREYEARRHAQLVRLDHLDAASAVALLRAIGMKESDEELAAAAALCGYHAKAVELLGTFLARFGGGDAARWRQLQEENQPLPADALDEERAVARVMRLFQRQLPPELQDILTLATAFREPPTRQQLLVFLGSDPVDALLQRSWRRTYAPLRDRPDGWLSASLDELIGLRLLESVGPALRTTDAEPVIDAHPLVRRAFEHVLDAQGRQENALARAGFLRGRPDRRKPESLAEASGEVEMFHAYIEAGQWNEADRVLVALDNPKHRFLAPAFERDLLLAFFPGGDWRQPPRWPGFGRHRSLAICFEMLGQFADALDAYPPADAALRGDALLALGKLTPLLAETHVAPSWQSLWGAYRAHALALAGRNGEALQLARSLVPLDIYEWVHVFEALLRCGALAAVDPASFSFQPPSGSGHEWSVLARRRMALDHQRLVTGHASGLDEGYRDLIEAYDRAGLAVERVLARLGFTRWLIEQRAWSEAAGVNAVSNDLSARHAMPILEADARILEAELARRRGDQNAAQVADARAARLRADCGYHGPARR